MGGGDSRAARHWFDAENGFLLRRVVYYGGAKMPFLIRVLLVDPWPGGTRQAETMQIGVAIAPRELEKPSPGGKDASATRSF